MDLYRTPESFRTLQELTRVAYVLAWNDAKTSTCVKREFPGARAVRRGKWSKTLQRIRDKAKSVNALEYSQLVILPGYPAYKMILGAYDQGLWDFQLTKDKEEANQ